MIIILSARQSVMERSGRRGCLRGPEAPETVCICFPSESIKADLSAEAEIFEEDFLTEGTGAFSFL
ncbi:hypothetical protein CO157_05915 [Candidatus Peregrinibacteria bacterium CG_4_9_14_3_um_filter_49_12]|nr:MAG: hypothetical protein CO157_05915 [Candidatus Peregrinibacteria bacterium CG_4_9_14_3_um_filter_49_12]